jgi:16S rRNA (uracil1498-N3)-methyltransferase
LMPRFYCPTPLTSGQLLDLPASAARHVQVLRLQPGGLITLFNGGVEGGQPVGGEFEASITHMGRSDVQVQVGTHHAVECEAACAVHLVLCMPANERMDWLVEKATELGVASIQPLMSERSVLRLSGERATKKVAHWQSIAIAGCEQSGRNQVPLVHPVMTLAEWLRRDVSKVVTQTPKGTHGVRLLLSLQAQTQPLKAVTTRAAAAQPGEPAVLTFTFLSGPEGGLSPSEETAALSAGFIPVTLGPRVLRAETAPLAALACLTVSP